MAPETFAGETPSMRAMNSKIHPLFRRAKLAVPAVPLLLVSLAALTLNGCSRRPIIVQTPAPTVIQNPAPAPAATPASSPQVIVMKEAPPPPRYEERTPPPATGMTWIPGYWTSRNGQAEWIAGHWDNPPRPNATWIAPRWERSGEGYVFIQGYWQ